MNVSIGFNRSAHLLAPFLALSAAVLSQAAFAGPDVTITNVPLPVTGSVNATVSGTVNANITNPVLPVTGSVSITGIPAVSLTTLPALTISSLPPVNVSTLPAVSLTVPAQPFFDEISLITSATPKAVGVSGRRLAVTTLTISNFDASSQQLFVSNPVMSGGSCAGSVIGGSTPLAHLILEPYKTIQLQYPTPMVFSDGALGCIAAEVTTVLTGGSVRIGVVGYATP